MWDVMTDTAGMMVSGENERRHGFQRAKVRSWFHEVKPHVAGAFESGDEGQPRKKQNDPESSCKLMTRSFEDLLKGAAQVCCLVARYPQNDILIADHATRSPVGVPNMLG
jgi:hypothetical protein